MRKLQLVLICVVGFTRALHGSGESQKEEASKKVVRETGERIQVSANKNLAKEDKKDKPDELSEFEKNAVKSKALIIELGDEEFAVRERAFRKLSNTPSAIPSLRRYLNDNDNNIERRCRVQALINDLSHVQFKSLLRKTAHRKSGVPLDLLVDIVIAWKSQMDTQDWQVVLDCLGSVQTESVKASSMKPRIMPDPTENFINFRVATPELCTAQMINDRMAGLKLVGEKIAVNLISDSAVFAGSIKFSQDCCRGFYLANKNLILERGGFSSFIFCGGDVTSTTLCDCVVIAKGKVNAKQIRYSIVLDASSGENSHFFSIDMVGLTTTKKENGYLIEKVKEISPAAKCGFRAGDLILFDDKNTVGTRLEEYVRWSTVNQEEAVFRVERNGNVHVRALSMFYN